MRYLRALATFVLGISFILSGSLKFIDPVGTGLQVKEYLNLFYFSFMSPAANYIGIGISVFEFLIGISILIGLRIRLSSLMALIMMAGFTLITLILLIFDPIPDCGCFGEAIRLTHWQSFIKNIILTLCAVFIFLQREKFKKRPYKSIEWYIIGTYGVVALLISIYALLHLPIYDFTDFRVGRDIPSAIEDYGATSQYRTTFIYEKDGKKQVFDIENLPDSTWNFVDSDTELISKTNVSNIEFSIKDRYGEYHTERFLSMESPLFVGIITDLEKMTTNQLKNINRFADSVLVHGATFILLTSSSVGQSDVIMKSRPNYEIYYGDYKSLITLMRSNGGVVQLYDGIIVKKWAYKDLPYYKLPKFLSKDPELLAADSIIRDQIFTELMLLAMILILVAFNVIFRAYA